MSSYSHRIQISLSETTTPTSSAAPSPISHYSDKKEENEENEDVTMMMSSDEEEEADFDEPLHKNNDKSRSPSLKHMKDHESIEYPINGECTSLSLSPSGNFLWAGFSDGTLRVFDLTGNFGLEQDAAVASRQKSTLLVASKWCQTYGAVACQIHARGVHTDLITQVGVCDNYVFCGVSRGAMELYAVDFGDLEKANAQGGPDASPHNNNENNILDYLRVHEKADAKLKGFGACTKLQNTSRPTYLLLTGKGIKNIHIWSFQPPLLTSREDEEPIWTQLYDTQTNGNTINLLGFYRPPSGNKLLGVSKSDSQKLRLWDLSAEEEEPQDEAKERSKRPPYVDVANSQAALGLAAGGFCVCGGPTMYNRLSIVSLDQPKDSYNHTELALPSGGGGGDNGDLGGARRSSSRRQRRGDLKQVVNVASPPEGDVNGGQVLLELDEGTIVQYDTTTTGGSASKLLQVLQPPTIPALPDDYWKRTICLASSKHHKGALVVAMSLYNPNTSKGKLVLRKLPGTEQKNRTAASLAVKTKSSLSKKASMMQTPPHRQSTPPVVSANNSSPETDLAAIKTLCMAPPTTATKKPKQQQSNKSDAERIKAKKEKKKKRKKEKMMMEEAAAHKRRSSDSSEIMATIESSSSSSKKKPKTEESKRGLSLSSILEADALLKTKDNKKKKNKKPSEPSEVVTPARKPKDVSKNASSTTTASERIFVNKVKVIPLSAEKTKRTATPRSSPSNSVNISSPTSTESDKKSNQGNEYETPAKKNPNSSMTTDAVHNTDTAKVTSLTQQVSPDSSVMVQSNKKPAKTTTTGEMDRFVVVSQKQLKMPKSKPPPPKLTSEQKEKQEQLKVASVPRKSRPNETVGEEMKEESVDEPDAAAAAAAAETEMQQDEEVLVEKEEFQEQEEEVTEVKVTKVPSAKKKRPRSTPASTTIHSSDGTESKKRKVVRLDIPEPEPKTPQARKKFSFADSPPTREDMHTMRVKAEYKRIQDLIANLPAFVPALLRPAAPRPKTSQEAQARDRSKLESTHRAAHEMIQRRMLRATESIIRNVVDYHLSIDEARDELKGTVQSFQEVVHETLQRQKLEAGTLLAQQIRGLGGGGLEEEVPSIKVQFPFQATFEDIEDARRAIEAPRRLPGRPRSG